MVKSVMEGHYYCDGFFGFLWLISRFSADVYEADFEKPCAVC